MEALNLFEENAPSLAFSAVKAPVFRLVVYGEAAPAGSKRAFPVGRPGAQRIVVTDANPKATAWKKRVAQEAGLVMQDRPLFRGPLEVTFTFYRRRPKGHFGKSGILKSAPAYPITMPDVSKTVRGCEDALTGVVWNDDSQLVSQHAYKRFGEPERVEIDIWEIGPKP